MFFLQLFTFYCKFALNFKESNLSKRVAHLRKAAKGFLTGGVIRASLKACVQLSPIQKGRNDNRARLNRIPKEGTSTPHIL